MPYARGIGFLCGPSESGPTTTVHVPTGAAVSELAVGFADFNAGMVVGIDLTTEDDPADFSERVWYQSGGQDGCADYEN